jgi:hypothetical protein
LPHAKPRSREEGDEGDEGDEGEGTDLFTFFYGFM